MLKNVLKYENTYRALTAVFFFFYGVYGNKVDNRSCQKLYTFENFQTVPKL